MLYSFTAIVLVWVCNAAVLCVSLQIAKEAKDCVQECVSEFVSFITSEYPSVRIIVLCHYYLLLYLAANEVLILPGFVCWSINRIVQTVTHVFSAIRLLVGTAGEDLGISDLFVGRKIEKVAPLFWHPVIQKRWCHVSNLVHVKIWSRMHYLLNLTRLFAVNNVVNSLCQFLDPGTEPANAVIRRNGKQ